MQNHFDLLRITRNNVLKNVEGLSLEILNTIPAGFNNNLAWNLGHLPATQQLLCYGLSGNQMLLENEFINRYRKGTRPEQDIDQAELDFIKSKLIIFSDKLEEDYNNQLFKEFRTYTTSYETTLTSVEDAIIFNNLHEAMHLGYILAIKRALKL
ncbi:MAG: DinB family protein [Bacteroidota bacterium]